MKLIITVIALISSMSAIAQTDTNSALAKSYTQLFFDDKLEILFNKMDSTMQNKVKNFETFNKLRVDVVSAIGEDPTFEKEEKSNENGLFVFVQTVRGQTEIVAEITWVLDSEGTIKNFFIRPKKTEAPSKYLNYQSKTNLHLPFDGTWTVFSGGRTLATNHHAAAKNQRFANDIAITKNGTTHINDGKLLTDYFVWGSPVLAPADGVIMTLIDGFPDNPIGTTDTKNVGGNYIVIDHGNGEFSFLAHFQKNSFTVSQGDTVITGQQLGLVGNSGNTSEPHLHYHLQDGKNFPEAECMPAFFHNYYANGKLIERAELAQGQQVHNKK